MRRIVGSGDKRWLRDGNGGKVMVVAEEKINGATGKKVC